MTHINSFSQFTNSNTPQKTEDFLQKINKNKRKQGDLSICLYWYFFLWMISSIIALIICQISMNFNFRQIIEFFFSFSFLKGFFKSYWVICYQNLINLIKLMMILNVNFQISIVILPIFRFGNLYKIKIINIWFKMTIFASMIAVQNPETKQVVIVQRDYEISSVSFVVRN